MSETNGSETPQTDQAPLPEGIQYAITLTRDDKGRLRWTVNPPSAGEDQSIAEYAFREAADWLTGNRLARQNLLLAQQIATERQNAEFAKQVMGGRKLGGPGIVRP